MMTFPRSSWMVGVFAAHGHAKFGALIHFHDRTVTQPQHGVGSTAGTNFLPFVTSSPTLSGWSPP